ncbi:response regulator [Castellaniella defragrans]|jgi:two-component system response regulator BaeR|uniref:Response regulator BaeR n=2 Tax=Castellaniella defragrans TaxID=75697 RepID=W8WXB3_CASD6|nr:response regulator [Castellaniella defragrans]KAB0609356.1 response regulator [Castellaniella defragrans]MBB6083678.1 two-component system response regulator BaeR [Castellaniella defragrans]CDM24194.1 Response regulator BaeR [Castellaniella defragrans 65Phen]
MRILVVEDEPKLAEVLRTYLQASGYEVRCAGDGLEVMPLIADWPPDLVLLDLMLPGRDGLDLCRDIRARTAIPVIMVTARTEEIDRLLGLELGADDYICKPYSPREVVARVKAVLRRSAADLAPARARETGGLEIDEGAWSARLDGVPLDLTPVEFRLLALLASQPGRIFSRDQVLDGLYDDRRVVTDRAVDSHVKNLRRKLAAVRPDEELIRSVYGVGYRLDLGGV